MIIGTAGHIDHGKTTLVRALSGVDTDRLKEEKARGITITLGYAYVPLDNGEVLGIIDVPGHEKLIHTMTAGASGIDFALLVIAADDGVMPQTVEHLAILQLLGVQHGAVALTKVDRVDAERLRQVQEEIRGFLKDSALFGAPVFDTNATMHDDDGVAALNAHLRAVAGAWSRRQDGGLFRLAVDRVFTLEGQGTIVAGTVVSGKVSVGDTMLLAPTFKPVRIRSIHAQNRATVTGRAGERCALNLAGIEKSAIARGDWLVDPALDTSTERIDVALTMLRTADIPLRHWTSVHVHLGTQHQVAHVALLDTDASGCLSAGQSGRVQLVFDRAICTRPGDRFIVRNAQANRTIGGGHVLDPFGPARNRRTPNRLAWLAALQDMLDSGSVESLLDEAPNGLARSLLVQLTGSSEASLQLPQHTHVLPISTGDAWIIANKPWQTWSERLILVLARFHENYPDEPGLDAARLHRMMSPVMNNALWRALIDEALVAGRLVKSGPWLHLPTHILVLDDDEQAIADKILISVMGGKFEPPWVRDLANLHGFSEHDIRRVLRKLARRGDVYQVVRDLFFHRTSIRELANLAATMAQGNDGKIVVGQFRDTAALGRKRTIQILEFFDRAGYTRFHRDIHLLRPNSDWLDLF